MRKRQHYFHAMRLLAGEDGVELLFVGGGPRDEEVRGYVDQHGISSIRWLDHSPREQLHRSLSVGEVHLVDVRADMVVVLLQLGDVPERRREQGRRAPELFLERFEREPCCRAREKLPLDRAA